MQHNKLPIVILSVIALTILFFSISNAKEISKDKFIKNTANIDIKPQLHQPVPEFQSRITKKFFGTYVTPKNSPVYPERFTGYHTGVDVEFGDDSKTISVFSISNGQVAFSGFVKGYGGVIVINQNINNQNILTLYGHLKPSSLPKKGTNVLAGDQIGILGRAYSAETDGERKHLHFTMLKGRDIDFRGYVLKKEDLQNWYNPLDFY